MAVLSHSTMVKECMLKAYVPEFERVAMGECIFSVASNSVIIPVRAVLILPQRYNGLKKKNIGYYLIIVLDFRIVVWDDGQV